MMVSKRLLGASPLTDDDDDPVVVSEKKVPSWGKGLGVATPQNTFFFHFFIHFVLGRLLR